jgi:hypothetical protein
VANGDMPVETAFNRLQKVSDAMEEAGMEI